MSGQRCRQVAGFILQSECKQQADAFCNECRKAVCAEHSRLVGERVLCIDCTKFQLDRNRDLTIGSRSPGYYYYDDPYFFTYRNYPSYRYRSDFDERDRESLDAKDPEGGFESDWGGS